MADEKIFVKPLSNLETSENTILINNNKYNIEHVHLKNQKTKKARRSSAFVIPMPAEKQEELLEIYNNNIIYEDFILNEIMEQNTSDNFERMEKMKNDFMKELDEYLLKSSDEFMFISSFSAKFSQLDFCERKIRQKNVIFILLYHKMILKLYHQNIKFLQENIREIFMFKDFLETKNHLPNIDLDSFIEKRIHPKPKKIEIISNNLITFKNRIDAMDITESDCKTPFLDFLSIKNKSGRIIQKYYKLIDQLEYDDLEVILDNIVSDKNQYEIVREFLFDLAWDKLMFPFADVEIMNLPNIFDLSPKIFSPKFLSEKVINTPFNELNSIDWPFKDLSNDMFLLLIERDPFVIAETFWEMSKEFTEIAERLSKEYNNENCEIGFDLIFTYFLISIFAFGVSEILEVMKFSYSFIDFVEPNDSKKMYAMTYFEALVSFINQISSEEYHKKYQ